MEWERVLVDVEGVEVDVMEFVRREFWGEWVYV